LSFLLDTNVVSELAKPRPNANAIAWFGSVSSTDLFLSVITLGEIRKGIEKKRMTSPEDAARLEAWFTTLVLRYRARVLSFDENSADQWGRVMALHPTVPVEDGQLVATALQHHLTFATRNVRHIVKTGSRSSIRSRRAILLQDIAFQPVRCRQQLAGPVARMHRHSARDQASTAPAVFHHQADRLARSGPGTAARQGGRPGRTKQFDYPSATCRIPDFFGLRNFRCNSVVMAAEIR
jgi:toxin FitB